MNEVLFTLKDIIYFSSLIITITGGFFSIKILTQRNTDAITELKKDVISIERKNDRIHKDLTELKTMISEINGFLRSKN